MKKFTITLISANLKDALSLQKIIETSCMNLISTSYFSTLEEGLLNIQKSLPNIIIIDASYTDSELFDFVKLFQLNGVAVIFITNEVTLTVDSTTSINENLIVKPFKTLEVIAAINKVIQGLGPTNPITMPTATLYSSLAIASLDKIDLIDTKDILFCMADGKYTSFFLSNGSKIVSSKNLGEYEKVLNPSHFYRVHHGYIVNIKYLTSIIKKDGAYCQLVNNIRIPIAKRKQGEFTKFIKIKT